MGSGMGCNGHQEAGSAVGDREESPWCMLGPSTQNAPNLPWGEARPLGIWTLALPVISCSQISNHTNFLHFQSAWQLWKPENPQGGKCCVILEGICALKREEPRTLGGALPLLIASGLKYSQIASWDGVRKLGSHLSAIESIILPKTTTTTTKHHQFVERNVGSYFKFAPILSLLWKVDFFCKLMSHLYLFYSFAYFPLGVLPWGVAKRAYCPNENILCHVPKVFSPFNFFLPLMFFTPLLVALCYLQMF